MAAEKITYRLEDGLTWVTLDDGKANAMQEAFFDGLNRVLDKAEADEGSAVIITGRPGFFSAGLDLKTLPALSAEDFRRTVLKFGETMLRVFLFPKPIVGAATGHAIAAGAILLLACDRKLCAEGAFKIGLNETAIGLVLPSLAIEIARASISRENETETMIHALLYPPQQARQRGLVDAVFPAGKLIDEAKRVAAELGSLPRATYAEIKRRLRGDTAEPTIARWREEFEAGASRLRSGG